VESRFIIRDGLDITYVGHPAVPYPSLDFCYLLGQDLPTGIGDENIPPKNLVRQISQAMNL